MTICDLSTLIRTLIYYSQRVELWDFIKTDDKNKMS